MKFMKENRKKQPKVSTLFPSTPSKLKYRESTIILDRIAVDLEFPDAITTKIRNSLLTYYQTCSDPTFSEKTIVGIISHYLLSINSYIYSVSTLAKHLNMSAAVLMRNRKKILKELGIENPI